jgi:enoyl-CoA hydratase/carnithine racemase
LKNANEETEKMSNPPVLLDISDRIATVTLNDPARRNPVTGNDMIAALLDTFAKVQADPQVSVMILTGADPAFCAGGDIKEMNDPDSIFRKQRRRAMSMACSVCRRRFTTWTFRRLPRSMVRRSARDAT